MTAYRSAARGAPPRRPPALDRRRIWGRTRCGEAVATPQRADAGGARPPAPDRDDGDTARRA